MTNQEIDALWERYAEGKCSPEEEALMNAAFLKYMDNDETNVNEFLLTDAQEKVEKTVNAIISKQKPTKKVNWFLYTATAAAAITVLLGIWTILFVKTPLPENFANDIDPGGNNATLTLPNGQKINLNDAKNGTLKNHSGIEIIKTADGQITYKAADNLHNNNNSLNTIATPKGGQYQIVLADGSKVWLNAASSLQFPATFAGHVNRTVKLSGEGYFEIAKNKAQPFIVKTRNQEVTVLGTHFNISSYADESTTNTTLLEGSVRISRSGERIQSITLSRNQQALNTGGAILVKNVDASLAIAWKNGEFAFRKEPLENIMLKLSRWYNVEVVFEDQTDKQLTFGGTLSRYSKISEVLCDLERTGDVKFKVEGRRVSVLK